MPPASSDQLFQGRFETNAFGWHEIGLRRCHRGRGPHGTNAEGRDLCLGRPLRVGQQSLSPSRKRHGLQDPELRARQPVDLFTNGSFADLHRPSQIISSIRRRMVHVDSWKSEHPPHPVRRRPFDTTHHNVRDAALLEIARAVSQEVDRR